jgi:hypothetical protein
LVKRIFLDAKITLGSLGLGKKFIDEGLVIQMALLRDMGEYNDSDHEELKLILNAIISWCKDPKSSSVSDAIFYLRG